MFKGLGSVPAVNPEPVYERPNHKLWFAIVIYINCLILIGCGGVAFFFSCLHFKYLTHCFISLYMVMFGIIAAVSELRFGFAQRVFGFACSSKGMGFVFVFAGTLGISFGVGKSVDVLVPFIGGILSVLVGVGCFFEVKPVTLGTVENIS